MTFACASSIIQNINRLKLRPVLLKKTMSQFSSSCSEGSEILTIVHNANVVKQRLLNAAVKAERNPEDICLVAVSKTKPKEDIQALYDAGYRHFGENYFQELVDKSAVLPKDIKWHFIGHLQSQKASKIVKDVTNLDVIETVDSIKLATKLNSACEAHGRSNLDIFVQVDTSGEITKSGVTDTELHELVSFISKDCPFLTLKGLMTIGAPDDYSCFDRLFSCRTDIAAALNVEETSLQLSMGMSGDFEEAISKGSTSVRVGSTIFGARIYANK